MVKILDVYFHEIYIGELKQDVHGEMSFSYASDWLSNPMASKISCSLPLQQDSFKRKDCNAFFGGLLPEEDQRKIIARNLGISANNDFSMLEKIGGECAGALSFIPNGNLAISENRHYQKLNSSQLANILRELPSRPLLAGEKGVRLSLAGVQDKLAVYVKNGKFFIPLDNAPSTHILKPDFNLYEDVIFNEAFCLKLAKHIGLSVAEADIETIEDINYLLIKRYDRVLIGNNETSKIQRIHQEDFCQALGIPSANKYQNEGGPSFKKCFDLIRKESYAPVIDLEKMLNAVIFNFLIGNCDAHGKNFSILYLDQLQFAPLYDLICTIYYKDLTTRMAMKLGNEYKINNITMNNFDEFADEIGFAKSELRKVILEMTDKILSALPKIEIIHKIQEGVASLIETRCLDFIKHAKTRAR
jgi:serine/threonine-protein kinase HipA